MSFPKFPEFQRLTVAKIHDYLQYYVQLDEPSSDFSINNLLIWLDFYDDLRVCELNDNLVLRYTNVLEDGYTCYSIIGKTDMTTTIRSLLNFLSEKDLKAKLYIQESMVSAAEEVDFPGVTIIEDEDNKDYVYNVADLNGMQGNRYRNLRERVIKFKSNKNIHVQQFDCQNETDKATIEQAVTEWSEHEKFARNDPDRVELQIIHKHLELAKHVSLQAYGIYIDEKLVCVVIAHKPPHTGWLIGDHLKYNYDYQGIFGFAVHELSLLAGSQGVTWFNFEQDLGKEGLRAIKTLLRPAKFIRRYTVSFDLDTNAQ